jgi:hypothetical protein
MPASTIRAPKGAFEKLQQVAQRRMPQAPVPALPPSGPPTMRASSSLERLQDMARQAIGSFSGFPPVRGAMDAMQLMDEAMKGNFRPEDGWMMGSMPEIPKKAILSTMDRFVADKTAAEATGRKYPAIKTMMRRLRGEEALVPDRLPPSDVTLPNNIVPGLNLNHRRPIGDLVRPRRSGVELSDFSKRRLDRLHEIAQQLSPELRDWSSFEEWAKFFPDVEDRRLFALRHRSLSPRVNGIPNMRDAFMVRAQRNMGTPLEEIFQPFEKPGFGIGLPNTKSPRLRSAEANGFLLEKHPGKVDELRQGVLGDNIDSVPLDLHFLRGLGVNTDAAPGSPGYWFIRDAVRKHMKSAYGQQGFPGMADIWTATKYATAQQEPGFGALIRKVKQNAPHIFNTTPQNKQELLEMGNLLNAIFYPGRKPVNMQF